MHDSDKLYYFSAVSPKLFILRADIKVTAAHILSHSITFDPAVLICWITVVYIRTTCIKHVNTADSKGPTER
jgi:hypothetical protein